MVTISKNAIYSLEISAMDRHKEKESTQFFFLWKSQKLSLTDLAVKSMKNTSVKK